MAKPRYLTDVEVSQITGRAVQTLRNDRHKGQGLPYRKFGRQVRYLESEVLEAMEARRIEVVPV
jgi:predicted DNA-binding transcriptional regulator AlpA